MTSVFELEDEYELLLLPTIAQWNTLGTLMMHCFIALILAASYAVTVNAQCPDYSDYSQGYHAPFSSGRYNLSYQRPSLECRTFTSQDVEDIVNTLQGVISDPDPYRLLRNSYPNTLDAAVRWKGYTDGTNEELTFLITGDINAMWLRDSANQMQ